MLSYRKAHLGTPYPITVFMVPGDLSTRVIGMEEFQNLDHLFVNGGNNV